MLGAAKWQGGLQRLLAGIFESDRLLGKKQLFILQAIPMNGSFLFYFERKPLTGQLVVRAVLNLENICVYNRNGRMDIYIYIYCTWC